MQYFIGKVASETEDAHVHAYARTRELDHVHVHIRRISYSCEAHLYMRVDGQVTHPAVGTHRKCVV